MSFEHSHGRQSMGSCSLLQESLRARLAAARLRVNFLSVINGIRRSTSPMIMGIRGMACRRQGRPQWRSSLLSYRTVIGFSIRRRFQFEISSSPPPLRCAFNRQVTLRPFHAVFNCFIFRRRHAPDMIDGFIGAAYGYKDTLSPAAASSASLTPDVHQPDLVCRQGTGVAMLHRHSVIEFHHDLPPASNFGKAAILLLFWSMRTAYGVSLSGISIHYVNSVDRLHFVGQQARCLEAQTS